MLSLLGLPRATGHGCQQARLRWVNVLTAVLRMLPNLTYAGEDAPRGNIWLC